jgi:hypothetical protein
MSKGLHLVFGGELVDPSSTKFRKIDEIDIVGIFPDYKSSYEAWKKSSQKTVDNAHMRYFIAHIHKLRDEEQEKSATEKII